LRPAPRTDPDRRSYRIRLLPWVGRRDGDSHPPPLVSWPVRATLLSRPVSRSRPADQHSPWLEPFAPPIPRGRQQGVYLSRPCSPASSLLRFHPTSQRRTCRAVGFSPSPTGPAAGYSADRLRDLPASMQVVYAHAAGLRLRGTAIRPCACGRCRFAFPISIQGRRPRRVISELHAAPARSPVNA